MSAPMNLIALCAVLVALATVCLGQAAPGDLTNGASNQQQQQQRQQLQQQHQQHQQQQPAGNGLINGLFNGLRSPLGLLGGAGGNSNNNGGLSNESAPGNLMNGPQQQGRPQMPWRNMMGGMGGMGNMGGFGGFGGMGPMGPMGPMGLWGGMMNQPQPQWMQMAAYDPLARQMLAAQQGQQQQSQMGGPMMGGQNPMMGGQNPMMGGQNPMQAMALQQQLQLQRHINNEVERQLAMMQARGGNNAHMNGMPSN